MNVDTRVTDIYKEFLRQLRLLEFELVFPIITYNTTPSLFKYVKNIKEAPLVESAHHNLYSELKTIVSSYICFHNEYIDEINKKCQDYLETCTKEDFVELITLTVGIHDSKQIDFGRRYLPVKSAYEKCCYENVEAAYAAYKELYASILKGMETLNEESEDRAVISGCLKKTLEGEAAIFKFTHRYLSSVLAVRIKDIDISVSQICQRLSNNLKDLQLTTSGAIKGLLNALYNKNKEWIAGHRSVYGFSSLKNAEIVRTITNIREKIKDCKNTVVVNVEEELHYWTKKSKKINKIMSMLDMLEAEFVSLTEQENYLVQQGVTKEDENYPTTLGKIVIRKNYLNKRIDDVSMMIFSMFEVRGMNGVWYTDENGRKFCIDEYAHQVFRDEEGKKLLHMDCAGNLKEVTTTDKYYYDDVGRYIRDDKGEKVYQLAPCTSLHKLNENCGLLYKITEDCGHSNELKANCKVDTKNILQKQEPMKPLVDIKGTMDRDSVQYLWKAFGSILPRVLHDVATAMPTNPMHFIAHSLIKYKYRKPHSKHERQQKKKRRQSSVPLVCKPSQRRDVKCADSLENFLIFQTHMLNEQYTTVQNSFD